jgi:hypothetical protein
MRAVPQETWCGHDGGGRDYQERVCAGWVKATGQMADSGVVEKELKNC